MKRLIDKFVPALVEQLGSRINPLLLRLKKESGQILVFCFHGLYESVAQKELGHVDPQNNFTVDQFKNFVDYFLEHHFQFICPDDLLGDLSQEQAYIMITFDDGYFNNWLALEIMDQYQIPATFFISTRNVLENRSFWWDIIYKYRKQEGIGLEKIRTEQELLKALSTTEIDKYIEKNFGQNSIIPWSDIDRPFKPAELQSFAENPLVNIGNHTMTHSILTNYNPLEINDELATSNQALLKLLGKAPQSMAFPNGEYNEIVLRSVSEAGFLFAFTTESRLNSLPLRKGNLICLGRFMAKPEDIENYGAFSRLGYTPDSWYAEVKKRIKTLRNHLPEQTRTK